MKKDDWYIRANIWKGISGGCYINFSLMSENGKYRILDEEVPRRSKETPYLYVCGYLPIDKIDHIHATHTPTAMTFEYKRILLKHMSKKVVNILISTALSNEHYIRTREGARATLNWYEEARYGVVHSSAS